MYYLITLFVFFIVGKSNCSYLDIVDEVYDDILENTQDLAEVVSDTLDDTQDSICEAFTDSVKHWRDIANDIHDAEVTLHAYNHLLKDDELEFDRKINRITVIIHGYLGDHENPWIKNLIKGLFLWRKQNMTVVVADWFKSYNYYVAAGAVDEVAEEIYKELKKLAKQYDKENINRPYLHIMGHSLGSHIAGLLAKKLNQRKQNFNWTVDRVTGFDPAKPFFNIGDDFEKYRLNKSYAKFVDVIHTNGAPNTSTFGLYDALGHIDFYPNGGDYQPNCKKSRGKKPTLRPKQTEKKSNSTCPETDVQECLEDLGSDVACIVSGFVSENENMVCDHSQAQKYFTKTLRGKKYLGVRSISPDKKSKMKCRDECCEDSVPMGINAGKCRSSIYHGQYFLRI